GRESRCDEKNERSEKCHESTHGWVPGGGCVSPTRKQGSLEEPSLARRANDQPSNHVIHRLPSVGLSFSASRTVGAEVVAEHLIGPAHRLERRRILAVDLGKHAVGGEPVVEAQILHHPREVFTDTAEQYRALAAVHFLEEALQVLHAYHVGVARP